MKILSVTANNRKHTFEVRTRRETLVLPYSKTDLCPLIGWQKTS